VDIDQYRHGFPYSLYRDMYNLSVRRYMLDKLICSDTWILTCYIKGAWILIIYTPYVLDT
jgi:hypothetical protein